MSCLGHVHPTEANQGLTTHELRAILLVLSLMGDQKGRIFQASYDGKGLTLQYSRLWSLANPSTAPLELFVRYRLSEPIGGIRNLSIR
ncbi:hypothetical protein N7517_001739 [Penicillium concentricum]|uniref:Uncharacterized protein n=1 Tax=Penicillium concentricum TaxID=293559 RepID=A0A9W9VIU2_9EURO|nr:uncharacterized protein N7517_001739 [Penicillium concentricum]KAJ5383828.1 hypothetical protein N7517_001739 [Penicillium concentricum]